MTINSTLSLIQPRAVVYRRRWHCDLRRWIQSSCAGDWLTKTCQGMLLQTLEVLLNYSVLQ